MDEQARRRIWWYIALGSVCLAWAFFGCSGEPRTTVALNLQPPTLEAHRVLLDGADTLKPVRIQLFRDTLYVSYNRLSRIDLYSLDLALERTISVAEPHKLQPTSIAVSDSELFVTDHARHAIAVFDHAGTLRNMFSSLPDGKTPLMPFVVTYYGGVLYSGDAGLHKVLAISMADAPGITERGELILQIPRDPSDQIGFPASLYVTPDGRLLIGDAQQGAIRVFTCDGRYVYDLEQVNTLDRMAPAAIGLDNVPDLAMQDSSSFDPSGVRRMGRIHVVDGNNQQIHMYNSLGRYLISYGDEDGLLKPSGIAVDRTRHRIYVADPIAGAIFMYRYEV